MAALPSLADLLSAIGNSLTGLPSTFTSQSSGADLFEGYVFGIILDAAQNEGGAIDFRNRDGTPGNTLLFRTSPGHLYSSQQNYSYAAIQFPNAPPIEAHLGVYVAGKSQLIHEADVLVLLSAEADLSRSNSVPPRSHACLLAIECSFYASSISLSLGRGFVGLCSDLSVRETFFVTNSESISV